MTDQYIDDDYDDDYNDQHVDPDFDEGDETEYDQNYAYQTEGAGSAIGLGRDGTAEIEGRTSWLYLALLAGLFVLLVFFSWACNDRSDDVFDAAETATEEATATDVVSIVVNVDGDIATLRGAVPDEAAREQLVALAQGQYGPENVIDELQVQEGSTLDGGSVSMTGSSESGDERPEALQQAISSDLGLEAVETTVEREDGTAAAPVEVSIEVDGGSIKLNGAVPDQESIDDLAAAAEAVWGADSVDSSGLTIAESTWTDGVVRATGTAGIGDSRADDLEAEIQSRFGALVTVDVSGLESNDDPAALTAVEDEINEQLALTPILFAPQSAEIESASDDVLTDIAETLNQIPTTSVEVVGHTDSLGPDDENLTLSQQRADAVIARLAELGVSTDRLNARGEGEGSPIADNGTDEGREQNRRIEFRIVAG